MTDKINTSRKKLRTKTGCFTCRQRRKKCDEKSPICDLCRSSGRKCIWPSASDLLDRRYSHHCDSRHQDRSLKGQLPEPEDDAENSLIPGGSFQPIQHVLSPSSPSTTDEIDSVCPLDLLSQAATVHRVLSNHLELRVSDHFSDKYFSLLLLPDCYRGFHDGWLTEIKQLMVTHKSLYYSVLACAASHIFLTDSVWEMHPVALSYYAEGVKELQLLLGKVAQYENHDALLMSVMLLYLHGCLGWGTRSDIAQHVTAATRIVTLRLLDKPAGIQRLFDRLAVESVIYQQFLLSTGLWSESSQCDFVFDPDFWNGVEKLLDRSTLLSGAPWNVESPVLGVPLSFFRTAMILRECYRSGVSLEPEVLSRIRDEISSERYPAQK
ncbi:transcriptional regulatory [Fusarium mexicanum]|uniref:Transcriptional regulatory n=1 Tax=Fusarium mexicanum TaxID=751941 RepID=A0A8H5N3Z3_9HYPO|nr:transcriptional regulatory [Fusarium mexicanum]